MLRPWGIVFLYFYESLLNDNKIIQSCLDRKQSCPNRKKLCCLFVGPISQLIKKEDHFMEWFTHHGKLKEGLCFERKHHHSINLTLEWRHELKYEHFPYQCCTTWELVVKLFMLPIIQPIISRRCLLECRVIQFWHVSLDTLDLNFNDFYL